MIVMHFEHETEYKGSKQWLQLQKRVEKFPKWDLEWQKGDKTKCKKILQSSAKTLTFWLPFCIDLYLIYIFLTKIAPSSFFSIPNSQTDWCGSGKKILFSPHLPLLGGAGENGCDFCGKRDLVEIMTYYLA